MYTHVYLSVPFDESVVYTDNGCNRHHKLFFSSSPPPRPGAYSLPPARTPHLQSELFLPLLSPWFIQFTHRFNNPRRPTPSLRFPSHHQVNVFCLHILSLLYICLSVFACVPFLRLSLGVFFLSSYLFQLMYCRYISFAVFYSFTTVSYLFYFILLFFPPLFLVERSLHLPSTKFLLHSAVFILFRVSAVPITSPSFILFSSPCFNVLSGRSLHLSLYGAKDGIFTPFHTSLSHVSPSLILFSSPSINNVLSSRNLHLYVQYQRRGFHSILHLVIASSSFSIFSFLIRQNYSTKLTRLCCSIYLFLISWTVLHITFCRPHHCHFFIRH